MRTEKVNENWLLCGVILPKLEIKPGQLWASADGSKHVVKISGVRDDWVGYTWGQGQYHEKSVFAFQCRYCLILPTSDIPKELINESISSLPGN